MINDLKMTKLQSIQQNINKLEKALTIIEKTENHILFQKSLLIMDICKNINILKDKQETIKNLFN